MRFFICLTVLICTIKLFAAQGIVKVESSFGVGTGTVVADNCSIAVFFNDPEKCDWFIITSAHLSQGANTTVDINGIKHSNFLRRVNDNFNDIEILEIDKNDFKTLSSETKNISDPRKYYSIFPWFVYSISELSKNSGYYIGNVDEESYYLAENKLEYDLTWLSGFLVPDSKVRGIKVTGMRDGVFGFPMYAAFPEWIHAKPQAFSDQCDSRSFYTGLKDKITLHCVIAPGMSGSSVFANFDPSNTMRRYIHGIISQYDTDFNQSIIASHNALARLRNQLYGDKKENQFIFWNFSNAIGTYRTANGISENPIIKISSGDGAKADGSANNIQNKLQQNQNFGLWKDNENIIGLNTEGIPIWADIYSWGELFKVNKINSTTPIKTGAILTEFIKLKLSNSNQYTKYADSNHEFDWIKGKCKVRLLKEKQFVTAKIHLQLDPTEYIEFELNEFGLMSNSKNSKNNFSPRLNFKSNKNKEYLLNIVGLYFNDLSEIPISESNQIDFSDLLNIIRIQPANIYIRPLNGKNPIECTQRLICVEEKVGN